MANFNHPKRGYCRDLPYELTQYVPHLSPPNPDKYQDTILFVPNLSSPSVKMPVRYPIPLNECQEMPCESFNNSLLCRISDCSFLPADGHDYRLLSPPPSGANLSMHSFRGDPPHLMKRPRLEIQSPINMENQEVKKQDIKRERNRVAAAKCRKKKLEKIAQLEEKAKFLRSENDDLTNTISRLKEELYRLRQKINKHYDSGCDIDLTQVG